VGGIISTSAGDVGRGERGREATHIPEDPLGLAVLALGPIPLAPRVVQLRQRLERRRRAGARPCDECHRAIEALRVLRRRGRACGRRRGAERRRAGGALPRRLVLLLVLEPDALDDGGLAALLDLAVEVVLGLGLLLRRLAEQGDRAERVIAVALGEVFRREVLEVLRDAGLAVGRVGVRVVVRRDRVAVGDAGEDVAQVALGLLGQVVRVLQTKGLCVSCCRLSDCER